MRVMHTLRVLLICLGFAVSDMCLPIAAIAFEVVEEGEEVRHHRTRRGLLRRALPTRARPVVGDAALIRVPKPPTLRRPPPSGTPSWRPARKVPAATSQPASALEDQS
jgi:hypothetical protein